MLSESPGPMPSMAAAEIFWIGAQMKSNLISILVVAALQSCGADRGANKSKLEIDSFHSEAMDGHIDQGFIETTSQDDEVIRDQIRDQLRYSIGLLNTWSGIGDMSRSLGRSITIKNKTPRNGGIWRVEYGAEFTIMWSKSYRQPQMLDLILPSSADPSMGMPEKFYERYAMSACLDPSSHDLGLWNFWYYIRPHRNGCQLGAFVNAPLSVRFPLRLTASSLNTSGHSPEYQKFWEDGRLIATVVFSKNSAGGRGSDEGVAQYSAFYRKMVATFGAPVTTSVMIPGSGPGFDLTSYSATFNSSRGLIDLRVYLVDGMNGNGEQFDSSFATATADSDLVMYNGHAGLGANVRGLARRFAVMPGQYQLFVLNGCDTFAYIDDQIMQKHKDQNPGSSDYKFVDIISNTMPSYFSYNASTAVNVIVAGVNSRLTYRQLLSSFDQSQHAVVFGEEDNDN